MFKKIFNNLNGCGAGEGGDCDADIDCNSIFSDALYCNDKAGMKCAERKANGVKCSRNGECMEGMKCTESANGDKSCE